jgi:hypothetical protein
MQVLEFARVGRLMARARPRNVDSLAKQPADQRENRGIVRAVLRRVSDYP